MFKTNKGTPHKLDLPGRAYQYAARAILPVAPTTKRYHVTIGRRPEYVWYEVAKVATRSILAHLQTHTELRVEEGQSLRLPVWLFRSHYQFAFVRDPWDRMLSCWLEKAVKPSNYYSLPDETRLSFEAFVTWVEGHDLDRCDVHLRLQSRLIDLDSLDFLGRLETFSADFDHVCDRLGIPHSEEHQNATNHDHYADYYTDALAERVGELYRRDIQLFGYEYRPARDLR